MAARVLMIQGTGSDVGKSLTVAGLCRLFADRGLKVAPFKPQNMANNAAVTADGGEIGRAQALQAKAARIAACVDMNPVLLKPQSEIGAQIVVQGRIFGSAKAREYQSIKRNLMGAVLDSFHRLADKNDLILVEGAGSASEVNLRANDIANMGFAQAVGAPIVLVGDIERGGVIASLVGTKSVCTPEDAALIKGFIVNRMRGDLSLFSEGMRFIAQKTGWTALGLVPFLPDAAMLPAEDALGLTGSQGADAGAKNVAVLAYPRIANFDDVDPLRLEKGLNVQIIRPGEVLMPADLVILPGSKATIADLAALRETGWDVDLKAHWRRGGRILCLCGGYQMLGQRIADPQGIEGRPGAVAGLGLLDVETTMTSDKSLLAVSGTSIEDRLPLSGYEMHIGRTEGPDTQRPFAQFADGRTDGAVSADGLVTGTYLHGLMADDRQRAGWLTRLGAGPSSFAYESGVEAALDALAAHLAQHIDLETLLSLAAPITLPATAS
jgi:adenosylcobyric acid synthase